MAEKTLQSDIFKFVSLRSPVSADKKKQEVNFIADSRKPEETPPGGLVKRFNPDDGTNIPNLVGKFIKSVGYDLNYLQDDQTLTRIDDFIVDIDKDSISSEFLLKGIERLIDHKLNDYYRSEETQKQLHEVWDRYYAFYMLGRTEPSNLDNLTRILRIYHLIYLLTKNIAISDEQTLNNALAAKPLIPKFFTELPKPKVGVETPKKEKLDEQKVAKYKNLWADLIDTHRALEEIGNIKFNNKTTAETKDFDILNQQTGHRDKSKLTFLKSSLVVNKTNFEGLNKNTKALFRSFDISESNFQISEVFSRLQSKLEKTNFAVSDISDPLFMKYMPEEAKLLPVASSIASRFEHADTLRFPVVVFPSVRTNIRSAIKPLGVGDLKVVKQKLKKYVAGEIAHIENVLSGEYKERKHRVLDRSEEIFTVSNEISEETTKDLQTTERFELKKESEKTIEEQMSIQAGLTVSGSYGMVNFTAHGEFAYSTAAKESNKSSSNFAREVIDKSVSKIQKKTKEERTTKTLHEVEEINTHGIDNKDKTEHVTGIYRWVDKHYEAQIYNYGKRMMFEFVIPEPAAFYEYAQANPPVQAIVPPKSLPENFTPRNIDASSYQNYIKDYNVQGITPPPLPYKTISASIVKDGMPIDGNCHAFNSNTLIVPAGYISKWGVWWDMSAFWTHYPIIEVTVGNKIFRPLLIPRNDGEFDTRFAMGNQHDNNAIDYPWFWPETPIQVSVNIYDTLSFTLNVYALVERTGEAYEQWQIQAFEKIMAAYKAMQAEYEQKVAAQKVQTGVSIHGRNPGINREIERTELKKQCIKNLMDTTVFGSFDAMKDGDPPDFDIFEALEDGKTIQFLEQAFEWENLTYLFYPYFWARKNQWLHKSTIYDEDPLFTKFLQAGSARVVIPVHPAYNDAVMYYLENNGALFKGGEAPTLKDDMFISIAEELRDQTDDLGGAKPEGEPWEVVLPTTLVWLQPDSTLPVFDS